VQKAIWYSHPAADDREGRDYDVSGRLKEKALEQLGVPRDTDYYICGPSNFIGDLSAGLTAWGVSADRIHSEFFAGSSVRARGEEAPLRCRQSTRPPV
jgi:ferredoxin-NADP reductase